MLYFIPSTRKTSSYLIHIHIIYLYRIGLMGRTCGVGSHVRENSDDSVTTIAAELMTVVLVVVVVLKSVTRKHVKMFYGKWRKDTLHAYLQLVLSRNCYAIFLIKITRLLIFMALWYYYYMYMLWWLTNEFIFRFAGYATFIYNYASHWRRAGGSRMMTLARQWTHKIQKEKKHKHKYTKNDKKQVLRRDKIYNYILLYV